MTSMYTRTITLPSYNQTQTLRLVAPSPAYAPITIQWIRRPEVTQYLGADFSQILEEDEAAHLQNMLVYVIPILSFYKYSINKRRRK